MGSPLLYEVNTRCWLDELASATGRPMTLDAVPGSEFQRWRSAGFNYIWLMGVWATGPRAARAARASPDLLSRASALLSRGTSEDIGASPYAISGYSVSPDFGGEEALVQFREALHRYGLKLVLDFIPNHVGLDHPWLVERPNLFVPGAIGQPGCFPVSRGEGAVWIAHGRDPYFPPWEDTAQLDYRVKATRAAMVAELETVAARCDGVRCDMAMLVLKQVFSRTWAEAPRANEDWDEDFWEAAIRSVKGRTPGFMFLAEAYWGLDSQLQALGFDYTYDKVLYDHLRNDPAAASRHLYAKTELALASGAYFLENHDERRAGEVFTLEKHRAAAVLILGLPGLRLIHEGQLSGFKLHVPVQFLRRPAEPEDHSIGEMYAKILSAVNGSLVGVGRCRLRGFEKRGESGCDGLVVIEWYKGVVSDLVVVNLGANSCRCGIDLFSVQSEEVTTLLAPPLAAKFSVVAGHSLDLEMPGYGCGILRLTGARERCGGAPAG